jgi:hypothetical protein
MCLGGWERSSRRKAGSSFGFWVGQHRTLGSWVQSSALGWFPDLLGTLR